MYEEPAAAEFVGSSGWLFLILGAALGILGGAWDGAASAVIALVGIGLGCLVTAVVLALEDFHRH
ncbi:hypothetical protein FHU36_001678 [Nonomuraea muscovyensis]|uniref:Uncharacterized protein n=1 Tax=Nonomuraea muscovyensis TaxID=1124761 RepID=A0A7X0EXA6_9ACTN|nr:hypothetical protein [Nonomuraea muscovyensis]MBB6345169.1 hypothetical protein [Nonomuraea muscovyensis]